MGFGFAVREWNGVCDKLGWGKAARWCVEGRVEGKGWAVEGARLGFGVGV